MNRPLEQLVARVLDGLRPQQSTPRGRPLQQFVLAPATTQLAESYDAASTPTLIPHNEVWALDDDDARLDLCYLA